MRHAGPPPCERVRHETWSVFAVEDRSGIFDYIEADNPLAAAAVDERIGLQARQLIDHPESGRSGRVEGTRELVIDRTSYILAYRVAGDIVRILRVLHSSQQWPNELPG